MKREPGPEGAPPRPPTPGEPPSQSPAQRPSGEAPYPYRAVVGGRAHGGPHPSRQERRTSRHREQGFYLPSALFVLVLVLSASLVVVNDSDRAEADVKQPSELAIEPDMVFFELQQVAGDQYLLEVTLYITNYGERTSGPIRLLAYAENKANDIVYDDTETLVDPVMARKTQTARLPITLPGNQSYRIRIFLFEHDIITITGYGEVSLSALGQTVLEFTTKTDENAAAGENDEARASMGGDSPALGLVGAVGAATLVALLLPRASRRRGP